ncbi:MAG TPA: two-component regulator propeller domain-containing protein [Puia sp.]|nr:two-component regulator propeller domain-containing protein [Puia sp.]
MSVCLLLYGHLSHAQQYFFARYTPKNGLINNRARSLFQDSKGRIYFCTYGGLSVYDGSRFTNYTTEDGLVTSLINDVVEMGEDSLWIIPNGKGLHSLVHGILRDIKTADDFYPVINQLIHGSDGFFYAVADEGFFRLERNRFVRIPLPDSAGRETGQNLLHGVEWNHHFFLVGQPYGYTQPRTASLIVYDLTTHRSFAPENTLIYYFPVVSPSHELLLATGDGVRKIDPDGLRHNHILTLPLPFSYRETGSLTCSFLYFDRSGNFWLVSGKTVSRIDRDGNKQVFTQENGLPPGQTNSILQDRENNIWFTNEQNGVVRLVGRQVQFYTQPEAGFTVTDMSARANSDSVWFFDRHKERLLLVRGGMKKIYRCIGVLPPADHILIGQKGYLIGNKAIYALHFLPGQRFRASLLYQDPALIDGNAFFDRRDNLILPSLKLIVLAGGKILQRPLSHLADQAAVDKYDRIWLITRSNELQVYRIVGSDSLELLHKYAGVLPNIGPRSITVDGEGRVWVGTRDHGLYCLFFDGLKFVSRRQITMANGLAENFIVYLLCDPDNTVWACTPTGLDKIRFGNGHFSIDDVTPCNDMYQRTYKILSSAQGIHWVMTLEGYMKIIPQVEENKSEYIPPVLFSKVLVAGEPVPDLTGQSLSLTYDRNTLSFYIGTPTFVDEGRTRYTWLLKGSRAPVWSKPSIQSAINFVNLPPGKYILQVKAQFPTGRYPDQLAAYSFVILPAWWQTWWFRLVEALVLTGIILLIFRSYTRRRLALQLIALEKKQAIEKERTRIATDMHDDLGSGLSRIKFLSETIGIKKQQQLPIDEEITGIRQYSHDMIDKMGEIVWALNEKNDTLSDLLSYTRAYAAEYLMLAGIRCTVEAPGDFPSSFVSGEFRRNVYLTIKETLHNIVKHAQASQVCITIVIGRELTVIIQDNGIGFNRAQVRPFSNGLTNMRRRIADIGGELQILSDRVPASDAGTDTEAQVPAGSGTEAHGYTGTFTKAQGPARMGTTIKIIVPAVL